MSEQISPYVKEKMDRLLGKTPPLPLSDYVKEKIAKMKTPNAKRIYRKITGHIFIVGEPEDLENNENEFMKELTKKIDNATKDFEHSGIKVSFFYLNTVWEVTKEEIEEEMEKRKAKEEKD